MPGPPPGAGAVVTVGIIALAIALSGPAPLHADASAVRVTPTTTIPASARCPQWWALATELGWPLEELPAVDRVMWCESHCQPGAHNRRSGASGLMQIMPGWWDGRDPYDPAVNLAMALEVHDAQGWRAWSCAA